MVLAKGIVMKYLLTLLLVMGMMVPAYSYSPLVNEYLHLFDDHKSEWVEVNKALKEGSEAILNSYIKSEASRLAHDVIIHNGKTSFKFGEYPKESITLYRETLEKDSEGALTLTFSANERTRVLTVEVIEWRKK